MADNRETGYHFADPVLVEVGNYPPASRQWKQDIRSTDDLTGTTLATPDGERVVITDFYGSLSANGTVTIYCGSNETGHRLLDLDVLANTPFGGGLLWPLRAHHSENVYVTTTGGGNLKLVVWGFTED